MPISIASSVSDHTVVVASVTFAGSTVTSGSTAGSAGGGAGVSSAAAGGWGVPGAGSGVGVSATTSGCLFYCFIS